MVNPIPLKRPVRWESLRSDEAQKVIRDWATDTDRVVITNHASERSDDRSQVEAIDTPMIYRILQTGHVLGDPIRNEKGHWQAIMATRMPGGIDACVVTVIIRDDRTLIVLTVMWKDFGS